MRCVNKEYKPGIDLAKNLTSQRAVLAQHRSVWSESTLFNGSPKFRLEETVLFNMAEVRASHYGVEMFCLRPQATLAGNRIYIVGEFGRSSFARRRSHAEVEGTNTIE